MSFAVSDTARLLMLRHGVDAAGFAAGMAAKTKGEADVSTSGDWQRCAALIGATQAILATSLGPFDGIVTS